MVDASSLRRAGLTDEEARWVAAGVQRIQDKAIRNLIRSRYYDGKARVRNLGIAVPPPLANIETVVGWPSTVVDALDERLEIDSFDVSGAEASQFGIEEWWDENNGPVDSSMAILDSLIFGVTFAALSPGDRGEPDPLLTIEPATSMTGEWNARARRLRWALHVEVGAEGRPSGMTLWTDTDVVQMRAVLNQWMVERDVHGLDQPPVVRLVNKPRTSRPWGQPELSRAVMSYTDAAVRTLLGMEVAREFYSSPQRWIMGATNEAFVDVNGKPIPAWEAYLGRFLALNKDPDSDTNPTVGQFNASSPEPYVSQVKLLAELLAAEGAMPVTYLGFHTQNPPGGDGIRAMESRLVKRAERRQPILGNGGFSQVIRMMIQMRSKEPLAAIPKVVTRWRDPSTPTKAATADAVTKYVGAGILPPDSDVTREMIGFDETTRARLAVEDRRRRSQAMIAGLAEAARQTQAPAAPVVSDDADGAADR